METYNGFFISGKAGLVHAFSPESYVAGAIYKQEREFDRGGYPVRVLLRLGLRKAEFNRLNRFIIGRPPASFPKF